MKTKIIITGEKVHKVGYRFFLADSANAYGIYNFRAYNTAVNNLQAVVVVAEGEEEDVKNYLGFVKENFPEQASVKEVAVKEYTGHIPTIDSFLLTFMAGQLNKGVPAILRIIQEESQKTRGTIEGESRMTRDTLVEHLKNDIAEIRAEIAEIKEKRILSCNEGEVVFPLYRSFLCNIM